MSTPASTTTLPDWRAEFETSSLAQWQQLIVKELKGKPDIGITQVPLPWQEELPAALNKENAPLPQPAAKRQTPKVGWELMQALPLDDTLAEQVNATLLFLLEQGCEGVFLRLPYAMLYDSSPRSKEYWLGLFNRTLAGVFPNYISLHFYAGAHSLQLMEAFAQWLTEQGHSATEQKGTWVWDAYTLAVWQGHWQEATQQAQSAFAQKLAETLPAMHFARSNAYYYNACGAHPVQELAYGLCTLFEGPANLSAVAPAIRLGVGRNFLVELAKFRALPLLWNTLAPQYAPHLAAHSLHCLATTAQWNLACTDPYNNLVRATTQGMAAVLGGAHCVEVQPYNIRTQRFDPTALRWSKNTQLLLKEESHLVQVADPAAGAYVVESLTDSIVTHTKALVDAIQAQGGWLAALQSGEPQQAINQAAKALSEAAASAQWPWVGENKYVTSVVATRPQPYSPPTPSQANLPTLAPLCL